MKKDDPFRKVLEAAAFAARVHRHQLRKDKETPYVSHVFRVCLTARQVFGIDDPLVLQTALLHDAIEDTNTDYDDIEEHFGSTVASWVALLSKDKRREDEKRESDYIAGLVKAPWQVQICKLADIHDNLSDSGHLDAKQAKRARHRSQVYLDGLKPGLQPKARDAFAVVERLLADLEAKG